MGLPVNLRSHFMSCVDLLSRLLKHVLLVQPYNPGLNEAKKKKKPHHFPRKRLSTCVYASDHFNRKKGRRARKTMSLNMLLSRGKATVWGAWVGTGKPASFQLGMGEDNRPTFSTASAPAEVPQKVQRAGRCSKVGAGNEVPWCVDLDVACVRRNTHFFLYCNNYLGVKCRNCH